jgi:large subunit ribosomal protein L20
MTRVKNGIQTKKAHKKTLTLAKGYWMTRHKQIKKATEAVLHAGQYAFAGRKLKKRDFRSLWIIRLNAAVRQHGMPYNKFVHALKEKQIGLDRKVLAQIAVEHPSVFESFMKTITA